MDSGGSKQSRVPLIQIAKISDIKFYLSTISHMPLYPIMFYQASRNTPNRPQNDDNLNYGYYGSHNGFFIRWLKSK